MTSIVGIRCRDGVVIGADSSATFGDGNYVRTIEQPTEHKIEIIGEKIIVAGTGYVGHSQRFIAVVRDLFDQKKFMDASALDIAKMLSHHALKEFAETFVQRLDYAAYVAYVAQGEPVLCELPGGSMVQNQPTAFQPEIKYPKDLWFASAGSDQKITDSFLALIREIFWKDGPPNVRGGIFTALWVLRHVCDVNAGGIKGPERIAVLAREKGKFRARTYDDDELAEHRNIVTDCAEHLGRFRNVLEGTADAGSMPIPPVKSQS